MLVDDFNERQKLNDAIDLLLSKLLKTAVTDDAYAPLVDQLTKLTKIKQIIVETQLKDFAEEEKAHEFRLSHGMKEREQNLKEQGHGHQVIMDNNTLELKTRELQQRQVEHDETFALKKREVDIKQNDADKPDRVSKDALVAAAASILGIGLIINYERLNVIASKALGFVLKR